MMAEQDLSRTDVLARYAGTRALVTGASGFLGRWVSRLLTEARADLVLAVRDEAAMRAVCAEYDIQGRVVPVDFRSASEIQALFRDVRPAITFNAVGYGIDRSERDDAQMTAINDLAAAFIAGAAVHCSMPDWPGMQVVHLGSALEYGVVNGNLAEDGVARPTTAYGRTKLRASLELQRRSARGDLLAITARLFTVYGPGEHSGRLLPTLLDAWRERQPVHLSAGTQRRDFTYVGDVAEGLLRLGVSNARPGWIVNLSTGRLRTVRDFAESTAKVLGMPLEMLDFGAVAPRPEEMQHDDVTIDRLRGLLGWYPPTAVEDGVRATVSFLEASDGSATVVAAPRGGE